MTRIRKLGLGFLLLLSLLSLSATFNRFGSVQHVSAADASATIDGDTITYNNVTYTLNTQTHKQSSSGNDHIYLPPNFNCGAKVVVRFNDDDSADLLNTTNNSTPTFGGSGQLNNCDVALSGTSLSLVAATAGGNGTTTGNTDTQTNQNEDDNTCEAKSGPWGWILCSAIDLIDGSLNWIDSQIQRLLAIDQDKYTNPQLQQAWATFRNIAYILLIPVMLTMVIGTALGFEIFSAYTVKRALPRMVVAVIFITLSWYICSFMITASNVVGGGVLGLVTAPFRAQATSAACQDGTLNLNCLFSVGGAAGGAGILRGAVTTAANAATVIGLVVFLVFFGTTLLIAAATAFLVLLVRQMIIIGLILLAPLAILAWIFPGNDKPWNWWWWFFSKLLLMFPLIMLCIAVGRVFAWLINVTPGAGLEGSVLQPVMKLFAYILPYALIPLTFKFAGSFMANIAGIANNSNKGLFDRAKNARAAKAQRWGHRRMFKNDTGIRAKLNTAGAVGFNANKAGVNPTKWKGRMGAALSNMSINQRDAMMEDEDYKSWKGYDQLNRAAASSSDERSLRKELEDSLEYHTQDSQGNWVLTAEGRVNMERDVAKVEAMRRKYGNSAMRQAAYIQTLAGGTATDVKQKNGETYSALALAASVAGTDRAVQAELVAKGRSAAGQAGRIDQSGYSFGDGMGEIDKFLKGVVDEVDQNGNVVVRAARVGEQGRAYKEEESRQVTRKKVYQRQGAGSLIHPGQKTAAVEAVAPVMREEADAAFRAAVSAGAGDEQRIDFVAQLASMKAVYDSLGSTNPDKARVIRDKVTSGTLRVGDMSPQIRQMFDAAISVRDEGGNVMQQRTEITYSQALQAVESNSEFQQFRKEFADQFRLQAAAAQQNAAAVAASAATQPPGIQPGPPAPGPP